VNKKTGASVNFILQDAYFRTDDISFGGRWILSDSDGFACARTNVLAFEDTIIPAFAMDIGCYSITYIFNKMFESHI
jgi:hypothetical protein